MQIVILAGIALTLSLAQLRPLSDDLHLLVGAICLYLGMTAAITRLSGRILIRGLKDHAELPQGLARIRAALAACTSLWVIFGSLALVAMGYAQWVMALLGASVPLVPQLLILSPFILALLLLWLGEYSAYVALRGRSLHRLAGRQPSAECQANPPQAGVSMPASIWTLRQYLANNLRHHLLFILVPVCIILLCTDLLMMHVAPAIEDWPHGEILIAVLLLATAGSVFLLAPALIIHIWRTISLPEGELRSQLEGICAMHRLRCRDIRLWQTDDSIANAGVMGMIAPVRYVLLSDALLNHMERHEIQAVFAHELGHVVYHHILYSVLFAAGTMAWAIAVTDNMLASGLLPYDLAEIATLGLLAVTWGAVFGPLSRRFERQSDVNAAWMMGRMGYDAFPTGDSDPDRITAAGAAIFARSLERVAQISGIPHAQFNWRHGSIARRVEYIIFLGSTGGTRRTVNTQVRLIKAGLWVMLAAGIALLLM